MYVEIPVEQSCETAERAAQAVAISLFTRHRRSVFDFDEIFSFSPRARLDLLTIFILNQWTAFTLLVLDCVRFINNMFIVDAITPFIEVYTVQQCITATVVARAK